MLYLFQMLTLNYSWIPNNLTLILETTLKKISKSNIIYMKKVNSKDRNYSRDYIECFFVGNQQI